MNQEKDFLGTMPVGRLLWKLAIPTVTAQVINMLEVNTTPGMTTTSFIPQQVRAAGLDIKDVLTEIIENQF